MAERLTGAEQHREIESHITSWLNGQDCPGVSVTIVDGDETVFTGAYGDRQLDPQKPVTKETLFAIGSSTKPITATAVMTLVDDGTVGLDDPVSDYVPFFQDVPGEPITIQKLLSHTSGMPNAETASAQVLDSVLGVETELELDNWDDFRAHLRSCRDARLTDHQRHLYYNAGYTVLSRLVEVVSGTSFPEYVQQAVFEPLGIERVTFDTAVIEDTDANAMTPYLPQETLQPTGLPDSTFFAGPGGLLAATPDIAQFLSAHITGELPFDAELAREMYEPVGTFQEFVDGTEWGYGYGWISRPFGEGTLIGHAGGTGVSAGYIGFLQKQGLGVAVGCNSQGSVERVAVELLAKLTDVSPTDVLPEQAITEKANTVEGHYRSETALGTATVEWTGDQLEAAIETPLAGDRLELHPASTEPDDYRFRTVESDGEVLTAEFFVGDESVDLLIGRNRFERIGDIPDEQGNSEENSGEDPGEAT